VQRKTRWFLGGAVATAVIAAGAGTGLAAATDDNDQPLSGTTRDRAVAAAFDAVGRGEVADTEVGDDNASYSVEVRLRDGRQVEVDLNRDFRVVGQETDDDNGEPTDD
jgi:hypothetical protein